MNELIKVSESNGKSVVSARELHEFLGVKTTFVDWIKRRVDEYGFLENQDYTLVSQICETNNPKNPTTTRTEYAITIEMAKELAMVERNDKGKQARQYFIECEKRLKELQPKLTELQQLQIVINNMVEIEKREMELKALTEKTQNDVKELDSRVKAVEAKQTTIETDYFAISGYCKIKNKKITHDLAIAYGKACKALSVTKGYKIGKAYDAKYGAVNTYHKDILSLIID